ncbi:hypothetical protein bcgnr5378_04900 [Bacillus cereus]|uniref:Uncharacterized protein n=1 Tax=Bacillus cereus TaxID=1396 RepID=A0A164LEH0_BACCE|nr:hypothetical protein [Bacillus cereus]KZD55727.1 hypothetical protein B4088_5472 [Bacillus cereus]
MNKKFFVGLSLAALLTGFVPNLGGTGSVHAEEKKLWDPIPKKAGSYYWYTYYDQGDIKSEEYTIERKLQVSNNTMLYNLEGQPGNVWISPQTVTLTEYPHREPNNIFDVYYKLDTWLGKKMIYRNVNEKNENFYEYEIYRPKSLVNGPIFKGVANQNIVPLYDTPREEGSVVGSITPQNLDITAVALADEKWFDVMAGERNHRYTKGFIGINTWLGEKWVSAVDLQVEKIEKNVYLADSVGDLELFDNPGHYPNSAIAGSPKISPQKVYAIQKVGDYIQIRTWLGDKWVKSNVYVSEDGLGDGTVMIGDYYISTNSGAKYYNSPNGEASNTISYGESSPSKIKVKYKGNDGEEWYLDKKGRWLKGSENNVAKEVRGVVVSKREAQMYDMDMNPTSYSVAPQSLYYSYEVGHWFLIDTWLGKMWVSLP